jgi:FkbM family methyltransferase
MNCNITNFLFFYYSIYVYKRSIALNLRGSPIYWHDTDGYFEKNKNRVSANVDALSDEKSKIIYLGLIHFLQSFKRKDYPKYTIDEEQYFLDKLIFDTDEVFVDCGAYDGDTIDTFTLYCPSFNKIVAFEPDKTNFEKLYKKHGDNKKIVLYNSGVYSNDGSLSFSGIGTNQSCIRESDYLDNSVINVKAIDNLGLDKVTFIKMDVEGSEFKALRGAEKTILKDKPKLAISIYHSNQDMIDILEYLKNLVPEYKFYVRTYAFFCETILYAIY